MGEQSFKIIICCIHYMPSFANQLIIIFCLDCRRHSLQFPEGVLNKHYEKLVQCDPHLKALLEGTAVSRSIPLCDHSDSIFEEQSALHLSSPLTHALEGLIYQPQPPSCPYSPLQGRCRRTGVIPKTEADSRAMDMHMSDISSPSSGTASYLIMFICISDLLEGILSDCIQG